MGEIGRSVPAIAQPRQPLRMLVQPLHMFDHPLYQNGHPFAPAGGGMPAVCSPPQTKHGRRAACCVLPSTKLNMRFCFALLLVAAMPTYSCNILDCTYSCTRRSSMGCHIASHRRERLLQAQRVSLGRAAASHVRYEARRGGCAGRAALPRTELHRRRLGQGEHEPIPSVRHF